MIASHLNPLGKRGNKIRFLTPDEQKCVTDNVQPEGVDVSGLTESISNFKQNELTLDFIHGLFDGDGCLSVYLVKPSSSTGTGDQASEEVGVLQKETSPGAVSHLYIGMNFTIVQDVHNLSLLDEIKAYFNGKGGVYTISDRCSIYKAGSKLDLMAVILPKMVNTESLEWTKDSLGELNWGFSELNLPLVKYNKVYSACKILELYSKGSKLNKEEVNEVIRLSYYARQESDNITLEKYVQEVNRKFSL